MSTESLAQALAPLHRFQLYTQWNGEKQQVMWHALPFHASQFSHITVLYRSPTTIVRLTLQNCEYRKHIELEIQPQTATFHPA